jgi:hypothetical protein
MFEVCHICHLVTECNSHHVYFGTANRKMSERYGMKVWLCPYCHTIGKNSVHHNRDVDLKLKQEYQTLFEKTHSREEFMRTFGRNYLD